ncbi:glycoside hydrolase family 32 protein [Polaribacter dokdonensis]|nr:glycoside hydrolase family 32 protein [Polaribacter dokdonensis]KOY52466.1 Beta-fructosidase, levanase/invertase [Polaribacter dokdonensis DSW-5]
MGCKKTDNTLIKKETIIEKKSGEQYRPAYHFTPEKNWMNDPNGLVYFEGEYHLFYQYYPDDNIWGPMHWGHAISKDMVHWKRLPIALFPDKLGYIFSGSAVIDWNNTTGFGTKEKPAMVAIYTYHDMAGEKSGKIKYQTQAIAYSLDKGRTWVKYEKNPVLENPGIKDFRDPKVFWHQESNKWIMSLAVHDQINFYSSKNLKEWVLESEFGKNIGSHGGIWECPDLFPIKDSYGNTKWVLLVSLNPNGPQGGSATQYFIGDFNGSVFTSDDTKIRWLDYGADNYAGVTFSDIPKDDGRRILIGWMSNWQYSQAVPTYSWRSAMTLPRELLLSKNNNEYYIQSKPIDEIKNILTKSELITSKIHTVKTSSYLIEINKEIQDFKINLQNSTGDIFKIETKNGILITDRTKTGDNSFSEEFGAVHKSMELEKIFNVKIFVDNSSVEIFLNNGELVMTELIFPTNPLTEIYVNEAIKDYKLTPIKPIWKTN